MKIRLFLFIILLAVRGLCESKDPVLLHPLVKEKFSNCTSSKKTLFIKARLKDRLKKWDLDLDSSLFTRYSFDCQGKVHRYFLISNIVRTHYQAVLINVDKNKINDYLLLSFLEPQEFLPSKSWVQALKKTVLKDFELDNGPDGVSGATLTHQATVNALKTAFFLEESKDDSL